MNKLELEGKWNEIKGAVKDKYAHLFDNETVFDEGKIDNLVGQIQEKTGQKKEEIEAELLAEWKKHQEKNTKK